MTKRYHLKCRNPFLLKTMAIVIMFNFLITSVGASPFRNPNVKVDHDFATDGYDEIRPSICANAKGLFTAWVADNDIYFSKSENSGDTWSQPVKVNNGNSAIDSTTIVANETNIYIIWEDDREGNKDIYMDWSEIDNIDFSDNDTKVNNGLWGQNPHCTIDDTNLYVVWSDDDIYFDKSPLNNIDFSGADILVNNAGAGTWQGSPTIATDGTNVYVVWADRRSGGLSHIYFDMSSVTVIDFSSPDVQVDDGGSDTYNELSPSIATDGMNIYVAWEDHDADDWDIFFDNSSVSTIDFSNDDVNVDTDTTADTYSAHVLLNETNVSVVWYDRRSGNWDVYIDSSSKTIIDFSGQDVMVNDPSPLSQTIPGACIYQNTTFVVWQDDREGNEDIYFSRSNDNSNWLSPNINVYNPGETPTEEENPDIVCNSNGDLFAVWEVYPNPSDTHSDIYFSMSLDGGSSWINEVKVNSDGPGNFSRDPKIAADENNVYITWHDNRNGDYDIFFDMTPISFIDFSSSDMRVNSDGPGNISQYPSIAIDGTNIYVVWEDTRDGFRDIYFDMSPISVIDFGSPDVRVNTDTPSNWHFTPSIATDGTNVYVAWKDDMFFMSMNEDIYFDRSSVSSINFTGSDILVNSDGFGNSSINPVISTDGINVYIAWEDSRNGGSDIYFDFSAVSAIDFSGDDVRVNSDGLGNISSNPSISTNSVMVFIVWQDRRNGNNDVYFDMSEASSIDFGGSDIIVNSDGTDTSQAYPSIDSNSTHVFVIWEDSRDDTRPDIYFADYFVEGHSFSMPLYEGWNLISLPMHNLSKNLETVFDSVDYIAVQYYNNIDNDKWDHYHIHKNGFNDQIEINESIGMWILMAKDDTLILYGDSLLPMGIPLKPGWNLVGYPSLTSYNRTNGLNSVVFGSDVDCIQWYGASTGTWHFMGPDDLFLPGMGYWVHSKVETTWEVPL